MIIPLYLSIYLVVFLMWDNQKNWSYAQISLLWELAREGLPISDMVHHIGKTEQAIREKAAELGIELKQEK